jgi:GGDEF domain-containing protein
MLDSHPYAAFDPQRLPGSVDAPITVFPNRRRFETGIGWMLRAGAGDCAVLHLALRSGDSGRAGVNPRVLNLAGNTLRAGMRAGALAYLGDAEFAVLLKDSDARQAAGYARAVAEIICGFKVACEGGMLPVRARIGGVMAGDCRDGVTLLDWAVMAGDVARGKPGCQVHLLYRPDAATYREPRAVFQPAYA